MANRHRAQRRAAGGRTLWNAKGSGTAGAIHAKHGFKLGGQVETGKATGGGVRKRGDQFARGGRTGGKSPYSSAHFGAGHTAHAGPPPAGGAAKKARGGAVVSFKAGGRTVQFKTGGGVPKPKVGQFRHGGECKEEDDDEDEEEDEEDERAHGGRMHHLGFPERSPSGMKKRAKKRGEGGHVDIYKTTGGTHYWHDDEHEEDEHKESPPKSARGGRHR